ncbi:MAG: hypothetical protein CMM85_20850 [Rhodothermaceae bacterium]|nr:hypothetical protein [Rhodothermaceae bacterium]
MVRPLVLLASLALATLAHAQPASPPSPLYPRLEGAALRGAIRQDYTPALTLGYGPARDSLYTYEQRASGAVCGVYTQFCITLEEGRDASASAFEQGVNAEHTWPQSRGTAAEPARSDLHLLFPAKDNVNSSRGNHPYAEIPDAETDAWYREDASQSHTPTVFLDEWSERANGYPGTPYAARFEPREDRSGDVARAVAYTAVVYEATIEASGERPFLATMLADLQAWNTQDPPDARERERSAAVAAWQGTENPFVLDPTLLDRAFGDYHTTDPPDPSDPTAVWINEVHYDNAGTDTGEFVEVAGHAGTDLAGWRLVLYNGNGGALYDDRALSGTLPDEDGGIGTLAFAYPTNGIQNGSPDGIALVAPDGALVQFLSYEGVFNATDGPAAWTVSADLGVEESSSTPEGHSLGLVGTGRAYADFAWFGPGPASPGALNEGQSVAIPTASSEPSARSEIALGLPIPNPSSGAVSFMLTVPRPSEVRAAVVDAIGREVSVVLDGLALRSSVLRVPPGLAPGPYTFVVTSTKGAVSRRFAVVR